MTRTRLRGAARAWTIGALALAASMGGVVAGVGPASAAEGDLASDLVGWWKLDETSGTVATDSSGNGRHGAVSGTATWNGGDGFTFSGGNASSGNAITLPNDLLAGLQDVTVDFDVWVDPDLPTNDNWFMYNLGNSATYPNGTGYLFTTNDVQGRYRATIAETGFSSEQSAARAGRVPTGQWRHVTFSIDGGTPASPGASRLYEDGVLAASNTNLTTNPSLMGTPDGTTTRNVLGRSAYGGDLSFKGRLRDFRIYSRALTGAEAAASAEDTNTAAVDADSAALTLGDTTAVLAGLSLPATGTNGSTISWATSDASVVTAAGAITRPPYGEPAGTATLTATITRGAVSQPKEFTITVLPEEQSDEGKAQDAVAAIELVHPDDVRGNLTLPSEGLHGTTLAWDSSDHDVVSDTGEVTRPAHGTQPVDVTLTVTATRASATASRSIVVRVQPMPAPADYEAYAFAYFAGESTDDGEKIYFGASRGNDPLDYDVLNDGQPVLASEHGEGGLRDPFIIRSAEGDRFYLLATDLKAYPAVDFGEAQETGSKYIEVWESTDLVNWSDQRHIKVSSDFAGNTWAPEAFYDEEAGEYVVYWASALYPTADETGRDIATSYQRMMYATTRDFVTFSEPQPWIDVKRGTGRGMIDATVVKDGDTYYRVVKDEATMIPRQEKSTDLRATVTGSLPTTTSTPGWQLVKSGVGGGQPNPWGGTFTQGEGPTIFRDNEDADRWYMFIDQPSYHGGQGYLAFETDDIASGDWTSVPGADLPSSPRHGTVIPVTQAELDTMRAAYQPDLLISDVGDVTATTRQGTAPVLPATVPASFGDETAGQVTVQWGDVDPASYAAPGTFTVTGTVARGSADHPVATVTVTDAADPVVELTAGTPDGSDGWWVTAPVAVTATASDASGVDSVELAVDGAPWVATAGATGAALVSGDGTHTVTARALDATGNRSSAVSAEVRLDATAPVSRAAQDAERRVTVLAADATSGLGRIETRTGAGTWATYTGPVQVGDAATTIEYRAVDRAGNVESASSLTVPAVGKELALTSVAASVAEPTARFGSIVPVTVRVAGAGSSPSGPVRVIAGDRLVASGQLVDGRVRLLVDATGLGVGEHVLEVRYDGSGTHRASATAVALRVTPAGSRTDVRLGRTADGDRAVARVRVTTDPAGQLPDRVRAVLLRRGSVVRSEWLDLSDAGRARWRVSPKRPGTYAVRVVTPAQPTLSGSADTDRVRLR